MTAGIIRRRTVALKTHRKPGIPDHVIREVVDRDLRIAGGCVPKFLGAPGECRNQWQEAHPSHLQLRFNHVREHSGGMRRNEARWINAGCFFHNVQGWELGHSAELRAYLAEHAV